MPVLLVIGSGPGISRATARRFGREGYSVALLGRSGERVEAEAGLLAAAGVIARGYVGDAIDRDRVRQVAQTVREDLGAVTAVLFTAFGNSGVGNVLDVAADEALAPFRLGVGGLLSVVQAVLKDLRAAEGAVILAANGAVGEDRWESDRFATMSGLDGVALESAAKAKLLGLLAQRLAGDGIHVGEVVVDGTIQGSPYASTTAIDPATVAEQFWAMRVARTAHRVRVAEER